MQKVIDAKSPLRTDGGGLATIPFWEIFLLFLHLLVAELNNYRVVVCYKVERLVVQVLLSSDSTLCVGVVDVGNFIHYLTLLHA